MITVVINQNGGQQSIHPYGQKPRKEYNGLSTDTKPVFGVNNADIFYEMDTHKVFMFDETNKAWLEQ